MKSLPIAAAVAALLALAPIAHAGDGLAAAKLLPADSTMVLNINFKRLRRSPVYKDILAAAEGREGYKKGAADLKKAGIDIEKDVDTLVLGAKTGAGGQGDGFVVVVEGRFSASRLLKVLRTKNADMKTRKHAGVSYYELKEEGSIAILGKRVVLAENTRMPSVIDLFKGKGSAITDERSFKRLTAKIDRAKDIWFVGEVPKNKGAGFGMPGAENIEAVSGSLDLRAGLGVRLRITSSDNSSASQLSAMINMGKGLAAGDKTAQSMGLDVVAQKMVVITDERDTIMKVDLTRAEAAKLKSLVEMAGGAM
jgi:hypothetical protein